MPLPTISTGRALLGRSAYSARVLALRPLAYWPMDDASGGTMRDLAGSGYNGTHINTVAAAGIGDGLLAGSYDGSTARSESTNLTLRTAIGAATAVTLMAWARVSGAGVWTDNTARQVLRVLVNGSNYFILRKTTANVLSFEYNAGGTGVKTITPSPALATTEWFHVAMVVSKPADTYGAYVNGAQIGSTLNTLGTWSGTPIAVFIGSSGAANEPWSGRLAHVAVFDRALSVGEVAGIGRL